jgi:exoribonuclease R
VQIHAFVNAGEAHIGLFLLPQYSRDEAIVRTQKEIEVIVRSKKHQSRALNGDTAAVQLLPDDNFIRVGNAMFPTGRVIEIIKQAQRAICGTIQQPI